MEPGYTPVTPRGVRGPPGGVGVESGDGGYHSGGVDPSRRDRSRTTEEDLFESSVSNHPTRSRGHNRHRQVTGSSDQSPLGPVRGRPTDPRVEEDPWTRLGWSTREGRNDDLETALVGEDLGPVDLGELDLSDPPFTCQITLPVTVTTPVPVSGSSGCSLPRKKRPPSCSKSVNRK